MMVKTDPLPSGSVPLVVEHAEMLPVERHAARVIRDREIRVAGATIGQHERLLVGVVDPPGVKLVGNHQLGFRAHEVTALGSMNEPFLEEALLRVDGYFARQNTLQRGLLKHRFLFTTDGFEMYEWAAKRLLLGVCIYGQVIKKRRENRVVRVDRRLLLGTQGELEEALFHSEDSSTLNTSFVERHNLTRVVA